jgi:ubiquinone/menaquinone biosynthesis C-methylase UbiE
MIMATYLETASATDHGSNGVRLQCPRCGGWIGNLPDTNTADPTLVCSDCYLKLTNEHGIWGALLPERWSHFFSFMRDNQNGFTPTAHGSADSEYYLALPYRDLSGHDSRQWDLRSRTFRYIKRHFLTDLAKHDRQLKILDLGAGNGWMSYRLALAGHAPIAVDLLTNDHDGLGAAVHYKKHLTTLFPRFQAEMDALPFVDNEFDLVIYNASFHYSENYERTVAEAVRCTRDDGTVIIADTPWYSSEKDGQQMIAERREASYGVPYDAINSLGYLTDKRLQRMEASFGIHWQVHTLNHGVERFMQQVILKLHDNYEPSQLRIYSAKVGK